MNRHFENNKKPLAISLWAPKQTFLNLVPRSSLPPVTGNVTQSWKRDQNSHRLWFILNTYLYRADFARTNLTKLADGYEN